MSRQDYTTFPVGTNDGAGNTIEKCPHCGRNGLHEKVNGLDFYTHSQGAGIDERGNLDVGFDMCPKPKASEAVSKF